jgi:hypothetical protein
VFRVKYLPVLKVKSPSIRVPFIAKIQAIYPRYCCAVRARNAGAVWAPAPMTPALIYNYGAAAAQIGHCLTMNTMTVGFHYKEYRYINFDRINFYPYKF